MGRLKLSWGAGVRQASYDDNTVKTEGKLPCPAIIMSPTEELKTIDAAITEGLKKYDMFDVDVRRCRIRRFKKLVEARRLAFFDPDLEIDDVVTFVVGKIGSDFEHYETLR